MIIYQKEKLKNILLELFLMILKKNIVSKMGMICQTGEEFCKYSGYIKTRVEGLSSGSGRAKHIYHIVVNPEKGLDSLRVEKQIVEDTEKGN